MKLVALVTALFVISSCAYKESAKLHAPITQAEREMIANPPPAFVRAVNAALPSARKRTLDGEAQALRVGRKLTAFERELAVKVGVQYPDKIRIAVIDTFPIEDNARPGHPTAVGLCMRYGVFMKPYLLAEPATYYEILAHEFGHVYQFEREGIDGLNRRLMIESLVLGDKLPPVEREAIKLGHKAYNDPSTIYGF